MVSQCPPFMIIFNLMLLDPITFENSHRLLLVFLFLAQGVFCLLECSLSLLLILLFFMLIYFLFFLIHRILLFHLIMDFMSLDLLFYYMLHLKNEISFMYSLAFILLIFIKLFFQFLNLFLYLVMTKLFINFHYQF